MYTLFERQCYHALLKKLDGDALKLHRALIEKGSALAAWKSGGGNIREPETAWRELEESGIRLVMREDDEFPPLLKEAHDAPRGLYVKGALSATPAVGVSIVGTRKATSAGLQVARDFARTLGKLGLAIFSGLAMGIDAAAHTGALEGGGVTVAVLPGGLDNIYPAQHQNLAERILNSGGALVSEYPAGSPAYPARFLERNRIVSGLGRATIVIEAPERSGALVTARLALDQNREVGAVPGPISHPNFRGTNALIKNGAALISDVADILELIGFTPGSLPLAPDGVKPDLNAPESAIFEAIKILAPAATVDKIIEHCKLEPQEVQKNLTFLIIKDIIRESGGKYELV